MFIFLHFTSGVKVRNSINLLISNYWLHTLVRLLASCAEVIHDNDFMKKLAGRAVDNTMQCSKQSCPCFIVKGNDN